MIPAVGGTRRQAVGGGCMFGACLMVDFKRQLDGGYYSGNLTSKVAFLTRRPDWKGDLIGRINFLHIIVCGTNFVLPCGDLSCQGHFCNIFKTTYNMPTIMSTLCHYIVL